MPGEQTTHAATLELADGRAFRFGPDEREVNNVLLSVQFDTELNGGFGPGQLVLPRPDPLTAMDARLFAGTRIYDAMTNQGLHEGQIVGTPRVGPSQIELQVQGWSKALEFDKTARLLGYDRDPSHWQGMSVQEKINLLSPTEWGIGDGQTVPDPSTGSASVELAIEGVWSVRQKVEAWYDARGLPIGFLDYAGKKSATVDQTDTHYSWQCLLSSDDVLTATDATTELRAAGPWTGTLSASNALKKFACARFLYDTVGGSEGTTYAIYKTLLGVVGNHGIPLQGSVAAPAVGRGLLASDVAEYIVGRWAPVLNIEPDSIEPTTFVIPQYAQLDDTTAQAMLEALLLYGGTGDYPLDWGVYDDRKFFMRSPGTYGRVWRVRRDQAVESTDDGPDSSRRINGCKVSYDDGSGTKRSVGPPGSDSDYETAVLADTAPSNPANEDGQRHWELLDAGITSGPLSGMTTGQKDATGAVLIGRLTLADRNRDEWRGTVRIKGAATDEAGNTWPAAMVRAGDRIVVEDDPDTRERRVVNTSYSPGTVEASCGAKPDVLDVLLARIGVVLEGRL